MLTDIFQGFLQQRRKQLARSVLARGSHTVGPGQVVMENDEYVRWLIDFNSSVSNTVGDNNIMRKGIRQNCSGHCGKKIFWRLDVLALVM